MAHFIRDAEPVMILYGPEQEAVINETAHETKKVVIHTREPYARIDFFRSASDAAPSSEIEPTDPGLIIYTSGTTGKPKGAVLNQGNLIHDARNIIGIWEIKESDALCHALPLFHVHGLCFALHTCLMAGAHVLLLDRFSPGIVVDLLSRNKGKSV
jgi:malonyl-CoA/methylmalonyl-CoA synthetase